MKYEDFAEATGLLRVYEKRLHAHSDFERLADTGNAEEALKMLSQNGDYDFSVVDRPEKFEKVLYDELDRIYKLISKMSKEPVIVDVLAAKYDYHNIKVALKSKIINKEPDDLFINLRLEVIEMIKQAVLHTESFDNLPDYIKEAVVSAEEFYKETSNAQDIDLLLDKLMYKYMLDLCKSIKVDFITNYVRKCIDNFNIKAFVRIKNMKKGSRFLSETLIDGGLTDKKLFVENYDKSYDAIASTFYYQYFGEIMKKAVENYEITGNFSLLEKLLDNSLVEHTKQAKTIAFGPEILFAYLLSKENEIRQIRILMTCKLNNIDSDTLRERLRDNYA